MIATSPHTGKFITMSRNRKEEFIYGVSKLNRNPLEESVVHNTFPTGHEEYYVSG